MMTNHESSTHSEYLKNKNKGGSTGDWTSGYESATATHEKPASYESKADQHVDRSAYLSNKARGSRTGDWTQPSEEYAANFVSEYAVAKNQESHNEYMINKAKGAQTGDWTQPNKEKFQQKSTVASSYLPPRDSHPDRSSYLHNKDKGSRPGDWINTEKENADYESSYHSKFPAQENLEYDDRFHHQNTLSREIQTNSSGKYNILTGESYDRAPQAKSNKKGGAYNIITHQ